MKIRHLYIILLLAFCFFLTTFLFKPLAVNNSSITFFDRNQQQLFRLQSEGDVDHDMPIPISILATTLLTEDQRYYFHGSIDYLSLLRAVNEQLHPSGAKTGASTISQQLGRSLLGINRSRTIFSKMEDVLLASFLDTTYSKEKIVNLYLSSSAYGVETNGFADAARYYFDVAPENVNWQQAALLAALLKNIAHFNPYTNGGALLARMQHIWTVLSQNHLVSTEEHLVDLTDIGLKKGGITINAPHFVYFVLAQLEDRFGVNFWHGHTVQVVTTLDLDLYQKNKEITASSLTKLATKEVNNSASLVLDNKTGEVLSYIGNNDFFDREHAGEVDMVQALRQPGSALKPFVYLAAILQGWGTGTVIFDIPSRFLTASDTPYTPLNYDLQFHGPVTMRQALANSYNVPAVKALEFAGITKVKSLLQQFGITTLTQPDEYYGLSLALGSGEVSLFQLTNAYRTLALQGQFSQPKYLLKLTIDGQEIAVPFSAVQSQADKKLHDATSLITDILADQKAREPEFQEYNDLSFPFAVAAKTGTSRNFHDNWTLGFSTDYTVGVWAGNATGAPMEQVSGITGAAPIFQQIMRSLAHVLPGSLSSQFHPTAICLPSGLLPGPYCKHQVEEFFLPGTAPTTVDTWYQVDGLHIPSELSPWSGINQSAASGVQILKPQEHDVFRFDPEVPDQNEAIPCSILVGDAQRVTIELNGTIISHSTSCTLPLRPGVYTLTIKAYQSDNVLMTKTVHYRVED